MRKTRIDRLDREYPDEKIRELYEEAKERTRGKVEKFIESYKEDYNLLTTRWNDIKELIFHVNDRINYWESRRTQFLHLTAAIIAASIVAIVSITPQVIDVIGDQKIILVLLVPVLVASIILLVKSISVIHLWNIQNNPSYPFTKGYVIWRWHYRFAEKFPSDTNVSSYSVDSFKRQVKEFADNLVHYKEKFLDASLDELIDQDLSQLYLCLINEKFKIKFVSNLRNTLYSGLRLTLWSWLVSLVLMLIIYLVFFAEPTNHSDIGIFHRLV